MMLGRRAMDRIKELSSASVPFEFDVHALIFSDDAPTPLVASMISFARRSAMVFSLRLRLKVTIQRIARVVARSLPKTAGALNPRLNGNSRLPRWS